MIDSAEVERLYYQGLTDLEISQAMSVTKDVIASWRHRRGLPLNPSQRTIECQRRAKIYESMYAQGYDDYHIARATGVRNLTVREWRKRRGLPEMTR
jgi:uncharacterized protein YjcR